MTTPDHLKPIEPASAVEAVCERIAPEIPAHAYGVVAELSAFLETRTPHDGRRLANALRHVLKRPDLAGEVEALLPPVPRPPDLEGVLQLQPSGRWAIVRLGQRPVEITSGDVFRVEVDGELKATRMEFRHFSGPLKGREHRGQPGEYYSTDGYQLRHGLRAALGDGD